MPETGDQPEEIDLPICGTVTPDYVFPSTSNLICAKLVLKTHGATTWALPVLAFIRSGSRLSVYRNRPLQKWWWLAPTRWAVLLITRTAPPCVIFGDGAGARLWNQQAKMWVVQDFILHSDGNGCQHLHMKAGGSLNPASHETVDNKDDALCLSGRPTVLNMRFTIWPRWVRVSWKKQLKSSGVWFVAHQANKRIIDATASVWA